MAVNPSTVRVLARVGFAGGAISRVEFQRFVWVLARARSHRSVADRALACLTAFIDRYAHDFFLRDNSAIVQGLLSSLPMIPFLHPEWLAVLSQLIAFVDADLSNRLHAMELHVELYAIPWLLTAFAHVLPLHKLFPVWDALLQVSPAIVDCIIRGYVAD